MLLHGTFSEGTHLMPATPLGRAQAIRWTNFEQTVLEANISPLRFFTAIAPELGEAHTEMFPVWYERGEQGLTILNNYLNGREFITEDGYTVADISVYGYTHLANEGGFDLSAFSEIKKWIERIESTPGYKNINDLLDGNSSVEHPIAA